MENQPAPEVVAADASRKFEVHLPSAPSSGAAWEMVAGHGDARLLATTEHPGGAAPGDPATTRFAFEALRAGEIVLRFQLKRPWESVARREKEILVRVAK